MGCGSYRADDWRRLRVERGLDSMTSFQRIYHSERALNDFDSRGVRTRYALDSEEHRNSTPIIIAFDNTASMGYLAEQLAKSVINDTITGLLELKPISDPQILCAAVGDAKCDKYPLQVTEFESDIRIVEQLLKLYIEGGGGGNGAESYNLVWYFASKCTVTDSFNKRQKAGYIFTIGNDNCHSGLEKNEINGLFAHKSKYGISNEELIRDLEGKFKVFHINLADSSSQTAIKQEWNRILPGRLAEIKPNDLSKLPDLIVSIIRICEGESLNSVLRSLTQTTAETLAETLTSIDTEGNNSNILSF